MSECLGAVTGSAAQSADGTSHMFQLVFLQQRLCLRQNRNNNIEEIILEADKVRFSPEQTC